MTKVVYNACYGGFSLSAEAVRLGKRYAPDDPCWISVEEKYGRFSGPRHDPVLVRVVEELGEAAASGKHAGLSIEDIPDGSKYRIDEYDGYESVGTPDSYEWVTPWGET